MALPVRFQCVGGTVALPVVSVGGHYDITCDFSVWGVLWHYL